MTFSMCLLLSAAHPFSVLTAPSQLTHPSMSLPQLPISRWPPLSPFLATPVWFCRREKKKWTYRVGVKPQGRVFLKSLWTLSPWDRRDELRTKTTDCRDCRIIPRLCHFKPDEKPFVLFIHLSYDWNTKELRADVSSRSRLGSVTLKPH